MAVNPILVPCILVAQLQIHVLKDMVTVTKILNVKENFYVAQTIALDFQNLMRIVVICVMLQQVIDLIYIMFFIACNPKISLHSRGKNSKYP